MLPNVVVIGIGSTTCVGLSAKETAASVRGRLARFGESRICDHRFRPFTVAEVPSNALPPLTATLQVDASLSSRESRLLRLATLAIEECLEPLPPNSVPVGLCLALPELETTRPIDRPRFLGQLSLQVGGRVAPASSDASHSGRAGGVIAIGQAIVTIEQGVSDFMLAGGVDSFCDPYVLGTLDKDERVKSESQPDGFIPGEGAGFVLLASARAAAAHALTPLGVVSPIGVGFESGHLHSDDAYRGEGLAAALSRLFAHDVLDAPVAAVWSSMNGENYWAKEWGIGYMRNRAAFRPSPQMHHPADCFGDTGAACGPVMLGLASMAIRDGYGADPAIVYGSSDTGSRAAVMISAIVH